MPSSTHEQDAPPSTPWAEQRTVPRIAADELHVWRIALNDAPERVIEVLDASERTRAARYRDPLRRRQAIAAQGMLRHILAAYLGAQPETLKFRRGPHGKPALAPTSDSADLHFNLSHSRDTALLAVSLGREVGVDLEYRRPFEAATRLAQRFFTADEAAALKALPIEQQQEAFFRAWTRKEALLKAMGLGITGRLRSVEVDSSGAPCPGWRPMTAETSGHWSLRNLAGLEEYAAALAAETGDWRLRCMIWCG